MTEEHDDARGQGRRRFLTGAAGLAAGAAVLGQTSPASAAGATGEHDLDLKWIDLGTGTINDVDLGTGGLAKGVFSAMGEMAAVSMRIKVGTGADLGTGPWCLQSTDMPTDYVPATPPNDITPVATTAWGGPGTMVDFGSPNVNQVAIGGGWGNWTNAGLGVLFTWSVTSGHNDGSGGVMVNFLGKVPFGAPPSADSLLYTTCIYLVAP